MKGGRASPSSRHGWPELFTSKTLRIYRGRRECRELAAPMVACKKARGSHHRFSRSIPAFPARWFDSVYALSPGTGVLAPVIDATREHRRQLDLSTGRPGPRDLAVRIDIVRPHGQPCCSIDTPTASQTQRFVTIAKRPSDRSRDATSNHDFCKNEIAIFSGTGPDDAIRLSPQPKLIFRRAFFSQPSPHGSAERQSARACEGCTARR
jgi:hypothetical protein